MIQHFWYCWYCVCWVSSKLKIVNYYQIVILIGVVLMPIFSSNFQHFSNINRIHMDLKLDIRPNSVLYCVYCFCGFHCGWHHCDNNHMVLCKSILTAKCQWSWCWMGLQFWCAYECILPTAGSASFRSTHLFQW